MAQSLNVLPQLTYRPWQHCARGWLDSARGYCSVSGQDSAGGLQVFCASGGVRVLVDQAAQDGFSADLLCVDAGHRGAGCARFVVGDALRYALVRPGRVVVRLVAGQDGAQVSLAEDQHAVQEFTAQGPGKAFAGGVHTWSLDLWVPKTYATMRYS